MSALYNELKKNEETILAHTKRYELLKVFFYLLFILILFIFFFGWRKTILALPSSRVSLNTNKNTNKPFYYLLLPPLPPPPPPRPAHATTTPLGIFLGIFVSFFFTHSLFIAHFFGLVSPLSQYYELLKFFCFLFLVFFSFLHAPQSTLS